MPKDIHPISPLRRTFLCHNGAETQSKDLIVGHTNLPKNAGTYEIPAGTHLMEVLFRLFPQFFISPAMVKPHCG